jgi:hypothetical protein
MTSRVLVLSGGVCHTRFPRFPRFPPLSTLSLFQSFFYACPGDNECGE